MRDPVFTSDGHTYERSAIERWLIDHGTSPQTNLRLSNKEVVPNHSLRTLIAEFRHDHNLSPPKPLPPGRIIDEESQEAARLEACPSFPGWIVAAIFLAVWLMAWAAGEITVAKEVADAISANKLSFGTFFTIVWLGAWSFGGCVACSAMYGLCCRECFNHDDGEEDSDSLQD